DAGEDADDAAVRGSAVGAGVTGREVAGGEQAAAAGAVLVARARVRDGSDEELVVVADAAGQAGDGSRADTDPDRADVGRDEVEGALVAGGEEDGAADEVRRESARDAVRGEDRDDERRLAGEGDAVDGLGLADVAGRGDRI